MKNRQIKKTFCLVAVLLLVLSAFVFNGTAVEEAPLSGSTSDIVAVNAVDNDNITVPDGFDHGYVPNISACRSDDGSYSVCVYQNDGSLKIIDTDKNGNFKSSFTVAKQLDDYAAFTKGGDGTYYVLFAARILDLDENKTALRVVNYSGSGDIIRSVDMPANASGSFLGIYKISCGNNVLCENGRFLVGHIGREMLTSTAEGLHHQASYGFGIDLETFTQIQVEHPLYTPYTTHSFHQFILKDGNDFIHVDRGDADPKRSFHITKMSGGTKWDILATGDSFEFKGEYGSNETYGQLGGMVKTPAGYVLVGTYQNTSESFEATPANLFTQIFNVNYSVINKIGVNDLEPQPEKYLTAYSADSKDTVTNPKTAQISADKVAVPYMVSNYTENTETMHIAYINANGELTGDKEVDIDAILPRFGLVFYNPVKDSIDWFSIENGMLVIHRVYLNNTHHTETTTEPTTKKTTEPPEETTTQATATQPETTQPTEQPTQGCSVFQRIIDFFIGMYNWVMNFFASLT